MDFRQKASARFAGVGSTLWWTVLEPACFLGVLAQTGEIESSSKILGQQYFFCGFLVAASKKSHSSGYRIKTQSGWVV